MIIISPFFNIEIFNIETLNKNLLFLKKRKHYDIEIKDKKQPLLLSIPKKSKNMPEPGGNAKPADIICLIPELCFLTGMTEDIKNDIHIKKVFNLIFSKNCFSNTLKKLNFKNIFF